MKKVGEVLFRNLGLKIAALIAAVILWFVIVNINDPEINRNFTCAVTIENADALAEQGKTYEIVDGSTAYFNVRAPRSVMKNLSESDFRAVADMKSTQDYHLVPINVTSTRYSGQMSITKVTKYLEITTEDLQTGQYIITPEQAGKPAKGYTVSSLQASPNVLKVSGPASLISEIDRVVATIHVDNIASDISDSVIPVLYDKNGRAIDTTRLTMNLTSVIVRAELDSVKEVGLSVSSTGTPAEGYEVTSVMYHPETISVKGDTAVLNAITQITIPPEVLDVTDLTDNLSVTVDISAYLPSGVTLVDTAEKDIDLVAVIEYKGVEPEAENGGDE